MNWLETKTTVLENFFHPVKHSVKIVSESSSRMIRKGSAKVWKSIALNPKINHEMNEQYAKNKNISQSLTDISDNSKKSVEDLKENQRNDYRKKNRGSETTNASDYKYFRRGEMLKENKFNGRRDCCPNEIIDGTEYESTLKIQEGYMTSDHAQPGLGTSYHGLTTSYSRKITDSSVLEFRSNSISENTKCVSVPCNLDNNVQDKLTLLSQERKQFISASNRSFLQNIYEPVDDEILDRHTCENIIQKKFIVGLNDTFKRRRSPMCTPICKSSTRKGSLAKLNVGSLPRKLNLGHTNTYEANSFMTLPILCGSTEQLDISFSSSHGSEDSISGLLSLHEEVEKNVDESDIHFETFNFLRKKRDEQFFLMKKITKHLKNLRRKNEKKFVEDILQAERELLFSTESYKNYIFNMTNCNYLLEEDPSGANAIITISEIMIPMKNRSRKDLYSHYICIARTDAVVLATKYIQPEGPDGAQYLLFNDELVFEKLTKDFRLDLEVYELNFSKKKQIFKRETSDKSFKVHHYRNVSSDTNEEQPLHSAFKQCGGFEISLKTIQRNRIFNHFPNSGLSKTATITKHVSDLIINVSKRGFLNFGQRHARDEVIIWNLKYVSLEESELRIYNFPEDLDDEPLVKIDLKKISSELVSHSCHLKYCFQLDIVCEDLNFDFSFKYPYFLRANTRSDFENWLEHLNNVMNILKQWHMLEYVD